MVKYSNFLLNNINIKVNLQRFVSDFANLVNIDTIW